MCLCASFLVRIAGAGAAPSPLHPPTRFYFFNRLPSVPTILLLFHKHHPFLGLISTLLISIETCAYVLLSWYALRGEALRPPPLLPAPAFTFLTGSPCYILTISLFFHKHHPFLGLISTLLMSIETCAYVLLSWYALRGRALRPPPCTPPPAFIFLTGSHLYLLFFCFFISIILSLGSFQLY